MKHARPPTRTTIDSTEHKEHIMLRVLGDGENRHRVEDDSGTPIGWVRGRAVGFHGLASEEAALKAVVDASRALEGVLRTTYPGWPRYQPSRTRLRLVHDGAYEWITDGSAPLARLLRIRGETPTDGSFGLEFVLPSYASEGVAVVAAQALGRALLPHMLVERT
jgi:hypothetical protein